CCLALKSAVLEAGYPCLAQALAQRLQLLGVEEGKQLTCPCRADVGLGLPLRCAAAGQGIPVCIGLKGKPGGQAQCLQPLRQRPVAGLVEGADQGLSPCFTNAGDLLQDLFVQLQPAQQIGQQAGVQQRLPGAGTYTGQIQPLFAAQPVQSCEELLLAARCGLPATAGMILPRIGRDDRWSLAGAPDHCAQLGNGLAAEHDRHLIAGADIQLLPALERAQAKGADLAVVQLHRFELQQWSDPAAAADAKFHGSYLSQSTA